MFDLFSLDPRLFFPAIPEAVALLVELIAAIAGLVFLVILVIAEWKIFKKLGEKPWKCLIPFYNIYILYKYTWKRSAFRLYLISSVAFTVLYGSSEFLAAFFPNDLIMSLLLMVALPFGIIEAVVTILFYFRLSESFGKGGAFGVGMIFFYPIFAMIIGFGRSEYVGNGDSAARAAIKKRR